MDKKDLTSKFRFRIWGYLLIVASFMLFLFYFEIHGKKKLRVLTKNSPTSFYYDREDQESGFEYELLSSFAKASGYDLQIKTETHLDKMLSLLSEGKADIVASGVTQTESRKQKFLFGPAYAHTKELLICNSAFSKIKKNKASRFIVVQGSSYLENIARTGISEDKWQALPITTEEALDRVENFEADCTISDEHIFKVQSRISSHLIEVKSLSRQRPIAWALQKKDTELRKELDRWMFDFLSSGDLEALYEKYFGFVDPSFNRFDVRAFRLKIDEKFLDLFPLFYEYSKKMGVAWELLAAISYQESHWDPLAKSPTGVRGLMMLTKKTAGLMKVNRLDPEQSIEGGARYLLYVKDRLPASIEEPDRTWVALAAYNVGIGHILDIRQLIVEKGGNPNEWKEIKNHLPLLTKEKYYSKMKYGYARGYEPVSYVRRIRTYYEILRKEAKRIEASLQ